MCTIVRKYSRTDLWGPMYGDDRVATQKKRIKFNRKTNSRQMVLWPGMSWLLWKQWLYKTIYKIVLLYLALFNICYWDYSKFKQKRSIVPELISPKMAIHVKAVYEEIPALTQYLYNWSNIWKPD